MDQAQGRHAKNALLLAIHKISALKEETYHHLQNSLFLESRSPDLPHFRIILEHLPKIENIMSHHLSYWSSLHVSSQHVL